MQKRFFSLLLCALTPIFCACATPIQRQNTNERITIIAPSEKTTDIWDTEKTDISKVDKSKKLVAFTFDDSPAKCLEELVAVFISFNEQNPDCTANATLFCNGVRINERTKSALELAVSTGFELGNHTFSHADLTTLSAQEMDEELNKTDTLLQKFDQRPLHLLRAPYGKTNDLVKERAKTPVINWTVDTLDWTGRPADKICQTVLSKVYSGAIVLFHDGYFETVSAVKRLLPALKEQGYQVVSVSQLCNAHDCPLKKGSVYIRARKKSG